MEYDLIQNAFEKFGHKCEYYETKKNTTELLSNYELTDIVSVKEIRILLRDGIEELELDGGGVIDIKVGDLLPSVGDLIYLRDKMYRVNLLFPVGNETGIGRGTGDDCNFLYNQSQTHKLKIEKYEQKTSIRVNGLMNNIICNMLTGTSGCSGSSGTAGTSGLLPGYTSSGCPSFTGGSSFQLSGCTSDATGYNPNTDYCNNWWGPSVMNVSLNIQSISNFPNLLSGNIKIGDMIRLSDNKDSPDGYYVFDGYEWQPLVTWNTSGPVSKIKRTKVYFSLDEELNDRFDRYCDDNAISKSKLIENYIRKYLDSR